jgi:hypothetical protein
VREDATGEVTLELAHDEPGQARARLATLLHLGEVKAASRWTERDLAGLRVFLERTPRCRAAIMAYNGEQAVRLGDKLWAVPLSTLLG